MKKIVAIVGSNSKKSNTYYFVEQILKRLKNEIKEEIIYEIFSGANHKINQCKGCLGCYLNDQCTLDNVDDMEVIKRKMLESDIVILASPVYIHNVSGSMKNFLDRISTWAHIMRLAGKYGVVITTTSSNGNIYVQDYLKSISTYLGLQLIGGYNIFVDIPNELYNQSKRNEIVERCCSDIGNALITQKKSNFLLEGTFLALKNRIEKNISSMPENKSNSEIEYWCKTGNIECKTFQDVLDNNI